MFIKILFKYKIKHDLNSITSKQKFKEQKEEEANFPIYQKLVINKLKVIFLFCRGVKIFEQIKLNITINQNKLGIKNQVTNCYFYF